MERTSSLFPSAHVIIPLKYIRTGIPDDQHTWAQDNSAGLKRDYTNYVRNEPCFLQLSCNYG